MSTNKFPSTRIGVEALENRLVMSVTATYNPLTRSLQISGDAANDQIQISDDANGRIHITDTATGRAIPVVGGTPTISNTATLWVSAGEGNDTVRSITTRFAGRVYLYGNGGNDFLSSPSRSAYLNGGSGNDVLFGSSQDDSGLFGGLHGEGGDDILWGGQGADALFGGEGRDLLVGGFGADFLYGDGGDDLLIGGVLGLPTQQYFTTVHNFWRSPSLTYQQRWQGLLYQTNGYTGVRLDDRMVNVDGSRDELSGGSGSDFFWQDQQGSLTDLLRDVQGEVVAWSWRVGIPGEVG